MTNAEKFKTAEEMAREFSRFCYARKCDECQLNKSNEPYPVDCCMAFWLELEAEYKPLPCPFCGEECTATVMKDEWRVSCVVSGCYRSSFFGTEAEAIAAHNRVAKAVADSKKESK